ncbi:MAG: hypothetical protein EZS28_047443, partial [Streblomastix strix]
MSHAYADCARAVSLAESALIAQIHHIIPDQPPSRYLIDAYLMCLTAGARLRSIRFAHPTQGQSRYLASSNYRAAQLKVHPHTRTLRTTEGATTTGREDTGNRTTINAHRIATDAWSRILNERYQGKEKKESRMELRVACRKMKYQKMMMSCWGDRQHGGDQRDLKLSPVQSGRQIIELLAAMEIDQPERQNTKRYSAYMERPRQCAQHRSPETQDLVQGRLRSTQEFIHDYLVRAGRRCYNPGPGLFRKVLESDIRDPKEERRLVQNPGLSNSEQRVGNRVFQVGGNNRYSGNNNAQRLGNNNRPASSLPPHQSSRRDATVSMLQLQWSLLQLQRNAVWSFNGPENLYQMPPTSNSRGQEAMQLANLRL